MIHRNIAWLKPKLEGGRPVEKRGREVVLGTTEEQIQLVARAGLATSISRHVDTSQLSVKPATHLAILYADRGDRQKSPGVPAAVAAIAIFADRRDRRIKSPISGMSDIGD